MMAEAQAVHMPVIPWTVNNRHEMNKLISLGVAGLISDHPALLREVMAESNMPLPPAYVLKKY
ncbi:MAG TPA: hypothetical protein DCP36_18375 [Sporomusaceae bacterium]|nr:hypothetical protein [Sporomusaceae bacterium]